MLGTWFSADHKSDLPGPSSKHPIDVVDHSSPIALTTPHDEILAELYGYRPEATTSSAKINAENTPEVNALVENVPQDSPPPESTVPTYTTITSNSASASAPKLYDPFSGTALGVLATPQHENPFTDAGSNAKDEELWSHLAEILRLQSDIAEAHLQMEDIGAKRGASNWDAAEAAEGGDEDEGMEGDEDADEEKARKEKFAKLADTFLGRRQKIDGVMGKLSELSEALTVFHALQTPIVHFPRSNTHPNTHPPSHAGTGTFDTDRKPPQFPKTHSTPLLSPTRPQATRSYSQPGSSRSAVPSLAIQPLGILQQPVVESPLPMTSALPEE